MRSFTTIPELDAIRRLPRLGKLALGVKATADSGMEYPREVEHFVVREDGCIPALREKFRMVYGNRPAALDVVLPCEDLAECFPAAFKMYGAGTGLKCIGDGQDARRIGKLLGKDGDAIGEFFDTECLGEDCPDYEGKACRRVASLTVMLPKVSVAGYWQIDTSSFHSRVDLLADLAMVRQVFGRIAGLISTRPPFDTALVLTREAKETQHGGHKRTHWPLHLRIRNAEQLDLQALQRLRLAEASSGLMIEHQEDRPEDLFPSGRTRAELPPAYPNGWGPDSVIDGAGRYAGTAVRDLPGSALDGFARSAKPLARQLAAAELARRQAEEPAADRGPGGDGGPGAGAAGGAAAEVLDEPAGKPAASAVLACPGCGATKLHVRADGKYECTGCGLLFALDETTRFPTGGQPPDAAAGASDKPAEEPATEGASSARDDGDPGDKPAADPGPAGDTGQGDRPPARAGGSPARAEDVRPGPGGELDDDDIPF